MPEQQLALALRRWGLEGYPLARLAGDVSHRRYYRLTCPQVDDGTAVVMVTPPGESAKMRDWIAVGEWLARHGVAVPRVLRRDLEDCVLLVTDAGDRLLTAVSDPAEAGRWYHAVLADLARLERAAQAEPPSTSPAHARRLEEQRIRWELRRFRKVVAAPVRDLSDAELQSWKDGEDAMVAALCGAPQVWMHRDLHARNLLLRGQRAWWIDFQDAMIGPWLYDLASLLCDPYAALPAARRDALRELYLSLPGRVHAGLSAAATERLFQVCTVQRLIHCVACYVWVCDQGGNDTYVRYLPFALESLRAAAEHCPAAAPLARVAESRWDGVRERWCGDAVLV